MPGQVSAAALRDAFNGSSALAFQLGDVLARLKRFAPSSRARNRGMPQMQDNGPGIHPSPPLSREEKEARVASIAINPDGAVVLQSQQPMWFSAIPLDDQESAVHGLIAEWQSSNPRVVSVEENGEAVAGVPGTAILTAIAGRARKNVRVTVVEGSGEPFGGKKKVDSRRATRNSAAAVSPPNSQQPKLAKKSEARRERSHSLSRPVRSVAMFLRDPLDDPLPDGETGSLFFPNNSVGQPTGRTTAGTSSPPVATEGTELPGSSNFAFAIPVVSLPGRGLDVSLSLSYNSRVFNKSIDPFDGSTQMTFDVDSGWPAAGFRLSFGQIEDQGSLGFTLTDPDGTRHLLKLTSTNNYDTEDGSFIHFTGGSGWGSVFYPDGMRLDFGAAGGGIRSYPTKIVDRNGNYLLISYVNGVGPKINTVQDTLGRFVRFYYAANGDLVAITAPGLTGQADRQIMRFYYQDLTLPSGLFNASISVNAPSTTRVIKYIYLPNDTESANTHLGYRYDYSAYGMIFQTAKLHGMTVSSTALDQTGTVSTEGTQAALTTYNYPTTAGALSDVPNYTRRTDDWAGRTTGMPTTGEAPYFTYSFTQATGITTITAPDNTVTETHTIVSAGQWNDGFVSQTITRQGATGPILAEINTDWERDANSKNPRPHQFVIKNDAQDATTIVITYSTYNNVTVSSIRGFDGVEVRRVETDFETNAAWINRRLLHLPTSRRVYAGGATSPSSRTDYVYDTAGSNLTARSGIIMHENAFNPFVAGYDSATDKRGNVTSTISYANAANGTSPLTRSNTRDIAGNVVSVQLACCQEQSFSYSSAFYFAYPTSMTVGSGPTLTTSVGYDFNTGLIGTNTDENGQITQAFYNGDSLRLDHINAPDGGGVTFHYNEALTADAAGRLHFWASTSVKLDATRSMDTYQFFDGRGQITQTFDKFTQANGWVTLDTEFDILGRAYRRSNPYYTAGYGQAAINPSGLWVTNAFDGQGRVTRVDMPSGDAQNPTMMFSTKEYSGVFTTITDQAGKQRRHKRDALGRLIRLDEPDASGSLGTTTSPAQSTSYEYDGVDNLIHVTQGSQHRYFRFDSLGRMTNERQVEQDAPYTTTDSVAGNSQWSTKFEYNAQGLLENSYNARQTRTHFIYDGINRIMQIEYFLQNGSADPATPPSFYFYDAQTLPANAPIFDRGYSMGRVVAMTYGSSTALTGNYYGYDKMGRVNTQKQVTGGTTYSLSYDYNFAGLLTSEIYPTTRSLTYGYDEAGRLSQVSEGSSVYASGFTYAAHGPMSAETFGNGAVHSVLFNRALQTSEIKLKQSAGGSELQRFNYLYGAVTQATGAVDTTKNIGQVGQVSNYIDGAKQWDQRFSYDEMARLKTAAEYRGDNAQQTWQTQYTYDRFGNRFQSGAGNTGVAYTPVVTSEIDAARNRFNTSGLTAITYDAAGNITQDLKFRGLNYQYDANGRQTSSQREDTTNLQTSVYDCSGQRVQTAANGATRQVVYDAFGQNVADYVNGALERENIFRNTQLFMVIDAPVTPASVPSGLSTTAGASVTLNWTAASGATNYRVTRATSKEGPYSQVGTTSSTTFNDTNVTSGTAYLYKVCSADGAGNCTSAYSNISLGVAFSFTDPTITTFSENPSNATPVKAAHITELRTVVNAVRTLAQLSGATWTNPTITAGSSMINKADIQDLRDRLNDALVVLNLQTQPYTDPTLAGAPNGTLVKGVHIRELRQRATSSSGSSCYKLIGQFVQDFYQGALGRQPSASELSQWTATLVQAQLQGANQLLGAAQSLGAVLFASTEYTSLGTDNPTYITDLYEGYLQRAPDPAGHANWLAVLNGGASRATLRNAFASSPEFQNKATSVCVNPGGSSSGTRYLISDTRGSTRAVMNNSGVGTSSVVARHDYLPFGEELWSGTGMRVAGQGYGTADGLRQKFGLMERDAASGLDNTWWRKYDSSSGRWTSPDPATASMTATDPQSFNRYSYVQNDPVNLIDPTGLFWIIDLASCRTVAWVTTGLDTHHQQTFEIQVCGLMWFPDFAPEPQAPRGGGRRPQRRQPRQHPPCPVQPLDPITDQQAQNFEAGNNVDVMGLTPGTQNALLCFEGTIRGGGGTTQLGSAYRPESYQRHLRDVWDKWGQLQHTNNPNCAGLRQQVQAEMARHQITEQPCLNGANCPHVEGRAFDMSVTLGPGQNRRTIMRQCGVSRPRPTADGGHHYEATNP